MLFRNNNNNNNNNLKHHHKDSTVHGQRQVLESVFVLALPFPYRVTTHVISPSVLSVPIYKMGTRVPLISRVAVIITLVNICKALWTLSSITKLLGKNLHM